MSKYDSQVPRPIGKCAVCANPGNTVDHVLFGQQKKASVAMKRWLESDYNRQYACLAHNIDRTVNTYEARKAHVLRILEDEGWVGIAMWLGNCPSEGFKKRDDYQEMCKVVNDFAED
jgi:hypothetical protein